LQSQANEIANLERIEVLKGPASILYGRIEPGGLINIVTKKPLNDPYYSVQQQFGSYDFYRTTVDATGSLLSDKSLLYRFNLAYQDNKSFRDFVEKERVYVAPSLSWQPNDATQINLNVEFRNEDRVDDSGIPVIGMRPAPIPISRFLSEPNNTSYNHGWVADLNWYHKFNDAWTIKNGILANVVDYELNSISHSSLSNDGTLTRGVAFWDTKRETESIYLELTGKAETFGMKHNMLFGGDYFHFDESINNGLLDFGDPKLLTTINIFDPHYTGVDFGALKQLRAMSPNMFWHLADQWFGLYAQDQITVFDKFHILLGGRYDWANNSSAFSTTSSDLKDDTIRVDGFRPRFGLLYRPWESFSIYANYVESLGSNNGRSSTGTPFNPQEGRQYEAGVKSEAFDGRLNSTLAFFHIVKENLLTADPNFPGTGIQRAIGEARSQGIELDVKGQITDNLNLVATYAFTDAIITKDTFNSDHRLANVPKHSGSLWAKYDITDTFSIGTGVYVVGQRMGDNENTFQLPGYVRWDAMAAYRWNIGKSKLTTQVNINNILDKTYFKSSDTLNGVPRLATFPGEPLTVMGSIRLEY
jgi:iron complex outermembrane recepter protein